MDFDRRGLLQTAMLTGAGLAMPRPAFGAAPSATAMLTTRAMQGDLKLLAEAYGALHPGLTRYLPPGGFAERTAALSHWAGQERSAGDFYLALARLTAAVRCGHSFPNPVNQSDAFVAAELDRRDRVPFAFSWIDGRMVVLRALAPGCPLTPGTIIDAVDGIAAPALLAKLLPLARADGGNDAKRVAMMAVDGTGRFGLFDVYRPLLAPRRGDGLIAVTANGRRLLLPAMTEAERKAAQAGTAEREGWSFDIADGVGRLIMPTWALYNSKWDWRGFLDASVDRLIDEGATGLVVDLRDNEGGQDIGDALLARLIDKPLALPALRRFVRYRKVPDALAPFLDTWDKSFRDWGADAQPSDRPGFFRLRRYDEGDEDDRIMPAGRRFAGKVAVLVSATCSSATFHFAQAVQQSKVARLVGTPTGGNQRGINGGAYFFVRLPATGMEVDLPLIGYFPAAPRPDAGIAPDIAVRPTIADIAAGRDRALAVARGVVG